jgi:tetratricopeptide (TPR) repeat protein
VGFALAVSAGLVAGQHRARPLAIEYPAEGSVFPAEIAAPTFLWHDAAEGAVRWRIEVSFADGAEAIRVLSRGDPPPLGEIDPRCEARPQPAAVAHAWRPDAEVWAAMMQHARERPATVTIEGWGEADADGPVSAGKAAISSARDPVGAPIFYRDVPLMPSASESGEIKPLPSAAVPLVGWRLRDISQSRSRLLLEGLPTCANCHSFSRDGKTMGMDVDGPENDKGTYAIAPIAPQMSIRTEDVITWNAFPDQPAGHRTIGFMSQLSPNGRYAVTTVNEELYVANFMDYRFLQVFYPTRGILAWYDRSTRRMEALPGADDPRYVHTNAVWSPDGKYLVFARAAARNAYPPGSKPAAYANEPNETPMQYDLYRIPFNGGRGGQAEPVAGASHNGMSNAFPKISPDGRWIVFVECRNGQLMRPDSQLYIVPAQGGEARRMRCNTPLMNSWHSFSPNGHWLVFASKSRSPYTQMFLTHLDEDGRDSPAVLIENSTAANRAVNIPEFVNLPPDGLLRIDVPAAEFYRLFDHALELSEKGQDEAAIAEWQKALGMDPNDPKAHNNPGAALARTGKTEEAVRQFRKAVELRTEFAQAHYNLGGALAQSGKQDEAIRCFRGALQLAPGLVEARHELGVALVREGKLDEAVIEFERALKNRPGFAAAHNDLGIALLREGKQREAAAQFRLAMESEPGFAEAHYNLAVVLLQKGQVEEAAEQLRKALDLRRDYPEAHYALGRVCYLRGSVREALSHWLAALETTPDDIHSLTAAVWVLAVHPDAGVRDGGRAVELAERALSLSRGKDPAVLEILAAAYAESGRYPDAAKVARQAAALFARQQRPELAKALEERAALYKIGAPYRDKRLPEGEHE